MSFSNDSNWADVTPIPQDDGPEPLVPIHYKPSYTEAMGYFRALQKSQEISERALELTRAVIQMNPAHYTVWLYRMRTLRGLCQQASSQSSAQGSPEVQPATTAKSLLSAELDFLHEFTPDNKKNYQIWHHRQSIVTLMVEDYQVDYDPEQELRFSREILELDTKNYHAWTYRQWVLRRFQLWSKELAYVDYLLELDVRNNSAWNQRYPSSRVVCETLIASYFVWANGPVHLDNEAAFISEVQFTLDQIQLAPENESPWNYLRGIVQLAHKTVPSLVRDLAHVPIITERCQQWSGQGVETRGLLEMLADIAMLHGDLDKAVEYCTQLAERVDVIRKKYWLYRIAGLQG